MARDSSLVPFVCTSNEHLFGTCCVPRMSLVNEQSCPALAGHPLYRDGWPTLCPELHHGTAVLLGLCPPGPRARGARAPLRGSLRPQSALWTAVALPPLATHHPRPRQGPHTSLGPDPPVPPPTQQLPGQGACSASAGTRRPIPGWGAACPQATAGLSLPREHEGPPGGGALSCPFRDTCRLVCVQDAPRHG